MVAVVGFRRTLVGLKLTDTFDPLLRDRDRGSRRTLVGLKPLTADSDPSRNSSFRRTLVGLKRGNADSRSGGGRRFRRTLVGLKLLLGRICAVFRGVSDVALLGFSGLE